MPTRREFLAAPQLGRGAGAEAIQGAHAITIEYAKALPDGGGAGTGGGGFAAEVHRCGGGGSAGRGMGEESGAGDGGVGCAHAREVGSLRFSQKCA
jgi:hypothetical protein